MTRRSVTSQPRAKTTAAAATAVGWRIDRDFSANRRRRADVVPPAGPFDALVLHGTHWSRRSNERAWPRAKMDSGTDGRVYSDVAEASPKKHYGKMKTRTVYPGVGRIR